MVTVKDPLRVAMNKLYPASIYASPALAPLMVGVGGSVGAAQKFNINASASYISLIIRQIIAIFKSKHAFLWTNIAILCSHTLPPLAPRPQTPARGRGIR